MSLPRIRKRLGRIVQGGRHYVYRYLTMGFASDLQGWPSHDALISVQEAELELLENMKRSIQIRVKCDREYSVALTAMCQQAMRHDQCDNEMQGSLITKAWDTIIDSTESFGHLIRQNADHLATHTLDMIGCLILEKRALKKVYLDEHQRIHGELASLRDAVLRITAEYERAIVQANAAKEKYEDNFLKGKGPRKVEDVRDRYIKAIRKLHQTHNDYVLTINEAVQYERHLRTILLPGLLEYQQTVLQEAVESWQAIIIDFAQHSDFYSKPFEQIHGKLQSALAIINSREEYQTFVDRYKSKPGPPMEFHYDPSLFNNVTFDTGLKPKEIAVDDLTIGPLREKIEELQKNVAICKAELAEKEVQLTKLRAATQGVNSKELLGSAELVKKRAMDILKRERDEMYCAQERLVTQLEFIRRSIQTVGDSVPVAVELNNHSHHSSPVQSDKFSESPREEEIIEFSGINSGINKFATRNIVEKFRNPFMKKQQSKEKMCNTVNSSSVVNKSVLSTNIIPAQRNNQLNSIHTNGLSISVNHGLALQDEEWFHGVLPREEVVRLLVNDGDYLVRETTRNDEKQIVLSVCWQGHKHFIVQTTTEGKFRFEGPAYNTIQELIVYHHQLGIPVTNKSGALLNNPINRERWELNNDDVQLVEKIGRGNFGDVYKAILHPSGVDVAVKTCRISLPDEQKKKFLQEGRILKQYDHPNVVKFIGICVQKQPIMIVMELVPGGSLLAYLRGQGTRLAVQQLLAMCRDCAAGMEYLEVKGCIHRDLAARNCLVGRDIIVKISDFGMSREEEEYVVSDGMKQIPIKWTAPEALNFGKYTSLCDVWSFGVLMWEIFALGASPYCGMTNSKARERIDAGYRLPAPEHTPPAVYDLMRRCWEYEPEKRPHFDEIHRLLIGIANLY